MSSYRSIVFITPLLLISSICFSGAVEDTNFFEMSLKELMQVKVITASRREESLLDAPANMTVITARQIAERGYVFLEDALRDLPGIDFVDVQGTFPLIWAPYGAYGDENKRTLLLIDGITENNILEGNVLGGPQYSMHNIERIEVIWEPVSALYGANALSGVINIITKKGRDINGFEYHKGYGLFDTEFDKLLVGGKQGDLEYSFSASTYQSDGPVFEERHPEYSNSYIDNAYSLVGRFKKGDIEFGFSRFDRPMGLGQFANSASAFFGLPLYGFQNSEGQAVDNSESPIDMNNEKGSLWHSVTNTAFVESEYITENNMLLKGKVYYRQTEIADDSYEYILVGGVWNRLPYKHFSELLGTELEMHYDIADNHSIVLGATHEYSDVERGYRGPENISISPPLWQIGNTRIRDIYRNSALFTEYKIKTPHFSSTSYTLGARYDDNNIYGSTFNPRLAMVSKPTDKWVFKALYGTAYRAPNSFDLFTTTTIRIANPDLKPEESESYELAVNYLLTPDWSVEAILFRNELTNLIASNVNIGDIDTDGNDETQNLNIGEAKITGLDLRSNFKLSKYFSGFANASYQNGEQRELSNWFEIPNIAKLKANLGLTWRYDNNTSIYIIERYVGDRSTAVTNPRSEVDSYFVTDISMNSQRFFNKTLSFNLRVNNLFDSDISDPGIRSADGITFSTQHDYPGRILTVQMKIEL